MTPPTDESDPAPHDTRAVTQPTTPPADRPGAPPLLYRSAAVARMLRMPVATLRIWQQRHRVAEPELSAGGHRLYSAADVQRLALLRQLTEQGHAIGAIAGLDVEQLRGVARTHASLLARPRLAGGWEPEAADGADGADGAVAADPTAAAPPSVAVTPRGSAGGLPGAAAASTPMVGLPAPTVGRPPPRRRYDDATLAEIAGLSSTIACECPKHVADLLIQLTAFEAYSAQCVHRSPADAQLHAHLQQVSGRARALLEGALERVVEHEGLVLRGD